MLPKISVITTNIAVDRWIDFSEMIGFESCDSILKNI